MGGNIPHNGFSTLSKPHQKFIRKFVWTYNRRMSKLTPKIILEGTRLTFKTEIAFTLNEHPRIVGPRKYRYS